MKLPLRLEIRSGADRRSRCEWEPLRMPGSRTIVCDRFRAMEMQTQPRTVDITTYTLKFLPSFYREVPLVDLTPLSLTVPSDK
jgi:hypothetical protein